MRQPIPLGDGQAVLCAAHLIKDQEPVLVMFGDTLYDAQVSPVKQVIEAYEQYGETMIGLSEVAPQEVSQFGVIGGTELKEGAYKIEQFIEKPAVEAAPSNLVQVGIMSLPQKC